MRKAAETVQAVFTELGLRHHAGIVLHDADGTVRDTGGLITGAGRRGLLQRDGRPPLRRFPVSEVPRMVFDHDV